MNPVGILTPRSTRALLAQLGHHPQKRLGQNFLIDGNIVRKSLQLAAVQAGDRVVEVGPGLGTLTGALLAAGAEVFAIERDPVLAGYLRDNLVAAVGGRLQLMEGDAVEQPLAGLPAAAGMQPGAFKIVANLPYAISSPWMEAVLAGPLPERMVLMLQLEAAQRYAADPGTKAFGAISVFLQAAYRVVPGHRVGRTCFYPQPDVDSLLLVLERRTEPVAFSAAGRGLVRQLFQHRRKQLAPLLRRAAPRVAQRWLPLLREWQLAPEARAEQVPVEAWAALDAEVRAADGSTG